MKLNNYSLIKHWQTEGKTFTNIIKGEHNNRVIYTSDPPGTKFEKASWKKDWICICPYYIEYVVARKYYFIDLDKESEC